MDDCHFHYIHLSPLWRMMATLDSITKFMSITNSTATLGTLHNWCFYHSILLTLQHHLHCIECFFMAKVLFHHVWVFLFTAAAFMFICLCSLPSIPIQCTTVHIFIVLCRKEASRLCGCTPLDISSGPPYYIHHILLPFGHFRTSLTPFLLQVPHHWFAFTS